MKTGTLTWGLASSGAAWLLAIAGSIAAAVINIASVGGLAWLVIVGLFLAALIVSPLPSLALGSRWTGWMMAAWLLTPATMLVMAAFVFALLVKGESLANQPDQAAQEKSGTLLGIGDSIGVPFATLERAQLESLMKGEHAQLWFQRAAEAGMMEAYGPLSGLALEAVRALPEEERDYGEALRWTLRAARAHDCDGLVNLGVMYERGWGLKKDSEAARALYQFGHQKRCLVATANLGALLLSDSKRDNVAIRALLKAASDGGVDLGDLYYGTFLYDGTGGPRDQTEARRLIERAARSPDAEIADSAKRVLRKLDI